MKYIITIALFFLSLSCKTFKSPISIKFISSTEDVSIYYSDRMNGVWAINLPINIKIKNNSSNKIFFRNYSYNYGNNLGGKAMTLYLINQNKLIKKGVSLNKYINGNKANEYLIQPKHFIDTTKLNRLLFKPYINKMLTENKDTLHIGTVKEFKQKHKELFEKLTKNDSISIQFLDGKKLGERITIPVKW